LTAFLSASQIAILLVAGAGAGFSSALLGVGGGFVMVPVMSWLIPTMGVPEDIAIKIAIGTSLLVILPTAMSGTWRHNRKKAVRWRTALTLGATALVGGIVGGIIAAHLPGKTLEIGFGGLVLAIALWMGLGLMPRLSREGEEPRENLLLVAGCGFPIGVVSGLTGLGGGALIVPMLVLGLSFPMQMAVGTSVAAIIFSSIGGIISYVINGLGLSPLPHSLGYINLPIWLLLAVTSIPLAQFGARAAHALPAKQLRYVFIAFMVYSGLRMIGVFNGI
jgi:uncharacterized membrane protein YfcA